jgi:hypothetical protein
MGVRGNEWNIHFDPYLPGGTQYPVLRLHVNGRDIPVRVQGRGDCIKNVKYDGIALPTAVIPELASPKESVEIEMGDPEGPILMEVDSRLIACRYDPGEGKMRVEIGAFRGHKTELRLISPREPESVWIDGKPYTKGRMVKNAGRYYSIGIISTFAGPKQIIECFF